MLVGTSEYFARSWYFMKFGMAMAARMPMIATTIMSSISVKPLAAFLVMVTAPLSRQWRRRDARVQPLPLRRDGEAPSTGGASAGERASRRKHGPSRDDPCDA